MYSCREHISQNVNLSNFYQRHRIWVDRRIPHVFSGGAPGTSRSMSVENGEEGELEVELPPPMKVMNQPMTAVAAQVAPGANTAASGPPHSPLDNILPDVTNRVSVFTCSLVCSDRMIHRSCPRPWCGGNYHAASYVEGIRNHLIDSSGILCNVIKCKGYCFTLFICGTLFTVCIFG